MGKRLFVRNAVAAHLLLVSMPALSSGQTFTNLASFSGGAGCGPLSVSLVQDINGDLYGTAEGGGNSGKNPYYCYGGCGTIFRITPENTVGPAYEFGISGPGINPGVGLGIGAGGQLYGTTIWGGTNNLGIIFRFIQGGNQLSVLYESSSTTGVANTPIQGADGNLYGTGSGGTYGEGTVFKLTPDGGLTVLYNFSGPDGSAPSQLIQATDGNFYGTTSYGGVYGSGTVFRITPKGALTTLYSFTGGNDGSGPDGGVTQAVSENFPASIFYGTTGGGVYGYGTIYKFAAAGALTTLHSFDGSDGSYPQAPLVQGTDGNFYGTTDVGGPNTNDGTIFQITPLGNFTLLHNFDGGDGAYLFGSGLVQRTDGTFFGTSESGGDTGCGTIYSLSMGLGPFVKTLPQFGRPGITIKILGTNLTGATSVTFNGRAASFSVGSPTEISAVVPAGATTGKLQVTIPGGRLLSSGPFVVLP